MCPGLARCTKHCVWCVLFFLGVGIAVPYADVYAKVWRSSVRRCMTVFVVCDACRSRLAASVCVPCAIGSPLLYCVVASTRRTCHCVPAWRLYFSVCVGPSAAGGVRPRWMGALPAPFPGVPSCPCGARVTTDVSDCPYSFYRTTCTTRGRRCSPAQATSVLGVRACSHAHNFYRE